MSFDLSSATFVNSVHITNGFRFAFFLSIFTNLRISLCTVVAACFGNDTDTVLKSLWINLTITVEASALVRLFNSLKLPSG